MSQSLLQVYGITGNVQFGNYICFLNSLNSYCFLNRCILKHFLSNARISYAAVCFNSFRFLAFSFEKHNHIKTPKRKSPDGLSKRVSKRGFIILVQYKNSIPKIWCKNFLWDFSFRDCNCLWVQSHLVVESERNFSLRQQTIDRVIFKLWTMNNLSTCF